MNSERLIPELDRVDVRLTTLTGGALGFELRLLTSLGVAQQPDLVSTLNFALMQELARRGIALKE